jgi:hypothetical protein
MPWQCTVVESFSDVPEAGQLWYDKEHDNWLVVLPNGAIHNIHAKFPDGSGWDITRGAPHFTVSPSIRCFEVLHGTKVWRQGWHGWLQNGILSDDCEGRTYETKEENV